MSSTLWFLSLPLMMVACEPAGKQPAEPPVESTDLPEDVPTPVDVDQDGYTTDEDCDDSNAEINPDAVEICDGVDNDCDGISDGDFDADGDTLQDCADDCPIFVVSGAAATAAGTHEDPFGSIQQAVDATAARSCPQVQVFEGTFEESINFGTHEVELSAHTDAASQPVIKGDGTQPVLLIAGGQTSATSVSGLKITGGGGVRGAGLYIFEAHPVIENNLITENVTSEDYNDAVPDEVPDPQQGGGLYLFGSDAQILGNEISFNEANWGGPEEGSDGGGLFARGGTPVISGNAFLENEAGDGGGLWFARSAAEVTGNLIFGNWANDEATLEDEGLGGQGGGINIQIPDGDLIVAGNLIIENLASTHGGGLTVFEQAEGVGSPLIVNNTFAYNLVTTTDNGHGAMARGSTTGEFYNNIFYGHLSPSVWVDEDSTFVFNNVFGDAPLYDGDQTNPTGNFSFDPLFTAASEDLDYTNDDWTTGASQCVDAGNPAYADTDGSSPDLGAYGGPYPY